MSPTNRVLLARNASSRYSRCRFLLLSIPRCFLLLCAHSRRLGFLLTPQTLRVSCRRCCSSVVAKLIFTAVVTTKGEKVPQQYPRQKKSSKVTIRLPDEGPFQARGRLACLCRWLHITSAAASAARHACSSLLTTLYAIAQRLARRGTAVRSILEHYLTSI